MARPSAFGQDRPPDPSTPMSQQLPVAKSRHWGRKIASGVFTILMVVLVVLIIPQMTSANLGDALSLITVGSVVVTQLLGLAHLAANWWVTTISLPGLSIAQAGVVGLSGAVVSNTFPSGGAVATGLTYAIRPLVGLRGRSHHRQHLHQRRLRTADALRAPGRRSGRVCRHRAIELAARPGGGHRGPRWLPARWRCWRSCCGAKGSPPLVTFPAIDATPSPRDHRNLDELEADLALPRSHVPVGKQVLADDARGVLPQTFARDPSRVSVGLMRTATPKSEKSSACPGSSQNVPVPNPIAQTPPTMRQ